MAGRVAHEKALALLTIQAPYRPPLKLQFGAIQQAKGPRKSHGPIENLHRDCLYTNSETQPPAGEFTTACSGSVKMFVGFHKTRFFAILW